LMNVQFAVKNAVTENPIVYVLEVNPRASRTVPFVSKATGEPLAKIAARCMVGQTLESQNVRVEVKPSHICVKEAVFPFAKFLGVDPVLGPEMRSTGEVMGVGKTFGEALFKSQLGSGSVLPPKGTVFISVRDEDKPRAIVVAAELLDAGYNLVATRGTAAVFSKAGLDCKMVNKVSDGRPNVLDKIKNHEIQLVITTSNESRGEISDARDIRMAALANRVTYYTTIAGGRAAVEGIKHLKEAQVYSLQEMYASRS
ncbi:MAG: carbamoyl phosphate synthase large subunit, partial [Sutterellaceae bacterium]|nr:carbamoyl phosphate synthase large subunit [Sutterellaceae bacterium]